VRRRDHDEDIGFGDDNGIGMDDVVGDDDAESEHEPMDRGLTR